MKIPKEPRILPRDYYQKDPKQVELQRLIENHYPEQEKYETLESKINEE